VTGTGWQEVGRLSMAGQRLWQAVLDTTVHKPAPMSAFDAFFHLALIVTLRGTQTVIDYYTELLAEMQTRVAEGISAVPDEQHRLLWDNLPIWYRTKWLSEKFASHKACLVADTYTSAWCGSLQYMNEDDFLGSMAEGYSRIYLNIGTDQMAAMVLEMIDKYAAEGLVMHSNRSCKPYSLGQYDIARIVQEQRGLPTLIIEANMTDARSFSESQVETRIDAFMEARNAGENVFNALLDELGIQSDAVDRIVATGYGRNSVDLADKAVTEITCHAAGAHFQDPAVRCVIDIGGQDSKAIALDSTGRVKDFAMNDKCAAGTGRFLEVMARALEVDLDAFGPMSLKADQPAAISSLCTVFAESEVISLIARGERRENIIAGIHESIGSRVIAMANRVGIVEPVMMTGGVAKNIGVVRALEKKSGKSIRVFASAQVNGAIGAALMAAGIA
jgi:predicted CoA-substrate-specific enzyme activase